MRPVIGFHLELQPPANTGPDGAEWLYERFIRWTRSWYERRGIPVSPGAAPDGSSPPQYALSLGESVQLQSVLTHEGVGDARLSSPDQQGARVDCSRIYGPWAQGPGLDDESRTGSQSHVAAGGAMRVIGSSPRPRAVTEEHAQVAVAVVGDRAEASGRTAPAGSRPAPDWRGSAQMRGESRRRAPRRWRFHGRSWRDRRRSVSWTWAPPPDGGLSGP